MDRPVSIPHPIHFVHLELGRWQDVLGADPLPSPDDVADRLIRAQDVWIVQTFLVLRARGHDVRLVGRFVPGAICVAHRDHLSGRRAPYRSYVVGVRADRDPAFLADLEIVQNRECKGGPQSHWLPHWPQPGLLPRDPGRGARVERVAFLGRARNLAASLRTDSFRDALAARGVDFEVRESDWHDYRDIAVVVGVRDGRPAFLAGKPASKLVNAWQAGCPAILGPEPAYRELRQGDLDYLEASGPEEVLAAVDRLRADSALYRRIVAHGLERGREYTREEVARHWERLLAGPVCEGYARWQRGVPGLREAHRMLRFAGRIARRRLHGRRYER